MIRLSAHFISHFCYTPSNDWVKCNAGREGETASSIEAQMSMLGQKGLETSGCCGNSTNLGVCSSCREIERPQERARIKETGFWGHENNVPGPRADKGRACCNSERPWLACLGERHSEQADSWLQKTFSFLFCLLYFEFTQWCFLQLLWLLLIVSVTEILEAFLSLVGVPFQGWGR